jgi:chromosome segregation ATPase
MLNIFQNTDGTFAWDNGVILLLIFAAGYLVHRFMEKRSVNKQYSNSVRDMEGRYHKLESEYKAFKSSREATERHAEKAAVTLGQRVKALEGDIRALAEEKNRLLQQFEEREQEIKKNATQKAEMEDRLKLLQESWVKAEAGWEAKLKTAEQERTKAMVWETKVRSAEEDTLKAKSALGQAERRKLEAELRLKATIEYAAKMGPLEVELQALKEKSKVWEKEISDKAESEASLQLTKVQLELMTQNNQVFRQELEAKQGLTTTLIAEIETLKRNLKELVENGQKHLL